jgi:hypothetical protein
VIGLPACRNLPDHQQEGDESNWTQPHKQGQRFLPLSDFVPGCLRFARSIFDDSTAKTDTGSCACSNLTHCPPPRKSGEHRGAWAEMKPEYFNLLGIKKTPRSQHNTDLDQACALICTDRHHHPQCDQSCAEPERFAIGRRRSSSVLLYQLNLLQKESESCNDKTKSHQRQTGANPRKQGSLRGKRIAQIGCMRLLHVATQLPSSFLVESYFSGCLYDSDFS